MSAMASPITSVSIVYSAVCSGADQRKHQSFASRAFVRGIHRWPVNSPHKGPVTRKKFPFDDVFNYTLCHCIQWWQVEDRFTEVDSRWKLIGAQQQPKSYRMKYAHWFPGLYYDELWYQSTISASNSLPIHFRFALLWRRYPMCGRDVV